MNKKLLYVFLTIFFFFIGINKVNAITCAEISEKIDKYYDYKDAISAVDCNNTSDATIVQTCNESKMGKNIIVSELMKLKEDHVLALCKDNQEDAQKIIEENKTDCHAIFDDEFTNWINRIMAIFYIVGPVLLIIFGTLDYAKVVISHDPEEIKKSKEKFFKRVIATILLFLSPVITNLIISLNATDIALSGNVYACNFSYTVYHKHYNIRYTPKTTTTSQNSNIGGTRVGDYTIFNQGDPQWKGETLLGGPDTIGGAGCALTSVAMQIVNSGVSTTQAINPSTLNNILKLNRTYTSAGIYWNDSTFATNGKFVSSQATLTGDIDSKTTQLANYLSQGYYPVIQVKCSPGVTGCSHYVAVFAVDDNKIIAGDPAGGKLITLNDSDYKIAKDTYNSQVVLYSIGN